MPNNSLPRPIESSLLNGRARDRIRHGFFTREGGVSQGIYAGLNVGLGSDDDQVAVQENRARVAAWFDLQPENLATVHQVHSPGVFAIDTPEAAHERPKADAIVTALPGVILGVLSADCGPVLFADTEHGVIGAAHAGWKGAVYGVIENTIDAMVALGAQRSNIAAVLGPSIGPLSYEVGPEFIEKVLAENAAYESFFSPSQKTGHAMFDLPALTLKRLSDAGITAQSLGLDTYSDPQRFFSYRRTTHAGEPDYGRQISAIAIREA